jgi:hypothetical protein
MKFFDRVKQLTTSTGTGALTLMDTPDGYRAFSQVFLAGDRFVYVVQNAATGEWEIGFGQVSSFTLLRESPLYGSSSVPVSFGSGSKEVFVAHPSFLSEADHARTFGTGFDGDVVITGTTVLSADANYRNLTLGPTGTLVTNGYRVRVSGICDLSNTKAHSIIAAGAAGGDGAAGGAGGTPSSLTAATTVGRAQQGAAGGPGGVAAGSNGTTPAAFTPTNGGGPLQSGAGGAGSGGAGGSATFGNAVSGFTRYGVEPLIRDVSGALGYIKGGAGGCGGGGGGGDGTAGGGGGAGGNGGGVLDLAFAVLKVGAGTAAATISSYGGNGGAGGSPVAGNRGGGGGGNGGGGGYCHLVVGVVTGGHDADLISCAGGAGGAGGAKSGTGVAGGGGGGSDGGSVHVVNLGAGTFSEFIGSAGGSSSGTTGGAGGVCVGGV